MSWLGGQTGGLGARPIRLPMGELQRFVEKHLAPEVVETLKKMIADGHGDEVLGGSLAFSKYRRLAFQSLDVFDVKGQKKTIDVRVSRSRMIEGETRTVPTGSLLMGSNTIYLNLNGNLTPRELLCRSDRSISECDSDYCLQWGLFSVLSHELTHAADLIGKVSYTNLIGKTDYEREVIYSNDPTEVRAFMRQVVEETRRQARRVGFRAVDQQDLIRMVLYFSPTWSQRSEYWTPANRSLILKAVYDDLSREGLLPR